PSPLVPYTTLFRSTSEVAPPRQLSLLLPLAEGAGDIARIVRIELGADYLARLCQHIDFGGSGFVQLLDARGRERLRANGLGILTDGEPLLPSHVPSPELPAGRYSAVPDAASTASSTPR